MTKFFCRNFSLLAILSVLSFTLSAASASATELLDLELGKRLEQAKPVLMEIEDPHGVNLKQSCEDCHKSADDNSLKFGDNTIKLCEDECHPDSNRHPVGVSPPLQSEEEIEKVWLPLGKGEFEGKVMCTTCHDVHPDDKIFRNNLLRGKIENIVDRREKICSACHGDKLILKSPHSDKGACRFCHITEPREGVPLEQILSASVQASCNFCHGAVLGGHYLGVNPFSDPAISGSIDEYNIPRIKGRFTCISCHNPHSDKPEQHLLRDDYLVLASKSVKINPHWKDVMCVACHDAEPEKGAPHLKMGGDVNATCKRCHNSEFARKELHPVGMSPSSKISVPDYMPLTDGKLTCETCHISSIQQEARKKNSKVAEENPTFLRKGLGPSRNAFCFRCHQMDDYARLNPHKQVDHRGRIREQICLFCHASRPDAKVLGLDHVEFVAENLSEYCVGCHQGLLDTGHPWNIQHVGKKPPEKILDAIETSVKRIGVYFPLYKGEVFCGTCHNPHDKGVLKIDAVKAGLGLENHKLRVTRPGMEICPGCHADKGSW